MTFRGMTFVKDETKITPRSLTTNVGWVSTQRIVDNVGARLIGEKLGRDPAYMA